MATIYQVAEKAGVSLSTVSRVLNGKGTVNAQMTKKVKAAAEALAYKPNQNARSLAAKHANTVGIVLPNQHMQFCAHLLFSIEQLFRNHQKRCLIAFSSDSNKSEEDTINYLHLQGCDGVIVFSTQQTTLDNASYKTRSTLIFNMSAEENNPLAIKANAEAVVSSAYEYLKQHNHRDIALITHRQINVDAMQASTLSSDYIFASQAQCANDTVLELVSSEKSFSALICTSQALAISAHVLLDELGFKVPQDVSVVTACLPGEIENKLNNQKPINVTTLEFSTYDIANHLVNSALQNFYDIEGKDTGPLAPVLHDYGTVSTY
jgi:LacI family transcriptional regulator